MATELPEYAVGSQGVNIVASPIHTPTGGLLTAENVEFIRESGIGGIGSRRGMAPLNAGAALAGSVLSLANIPLTFPGVIELMVGLDSATANSWKTTPDGVTFTNIAATTLERRSALSKIPSGSGPGSISIGQRCASFKGAFYFPGDNYTQGTTAPPVVRWDGVTAYEQFRVPNNPTSDEVPLWISDFWVADGIVYFAVWDHGGSAPNHKGRVMSFDPSNGSLAQIANAFGDGSGENTKGFPFCLTSAFGYLWAGTYGIAGNNQGGVYRCLPGIDTGWTLDLTATLHNGYFMTLAPYNGKLYAGTDADSSGTAIVQVRNGTGTWSTSFTAPSAAQSYFAGLIVFNNLLFCAWYQGGGSPACLIKMFDGSTWTTDLDVLGTYSNRFPGMPFIFGGALYWPFIDGSGGGSTGFLLKRTTGGVWSQPIAAAGLAGCLGTFIPKS